MSRCSGKVKAVALRGGQTTVSTGRAHFQQQCRAGDANARKGRARAGNKRWLRALQGQGALGRHLQPFKTAKGFERCVHLRLYTANSPPNLCPR